MFRRRVTDSVENLIEAVDLLPQKHLDPQKPTKVYMLLQEFSSVPKILPKNTYLSNTALDQSLPI
jgi:hypothetical protein